MKIRHDTIIGYESTLAKPGYCNKRSTKNRPMSDDSCARAATKLSERNSKVGQCR